MHKVKKKKSTLNSKQNHKYIPDINRDINTQCKKISIQNKYKNLQNI